MISIDGRPMLKRLDKTPYSRYVKGALIPRKDVVRLIWCVRLLGWIWYTYIYALYSYI